MISFVLGVDDLAATRFAISPLQETVCSLWVLRDPGRYALHLPWRRSVLRDIDNGGLDSRLLLSLVGESRTLPDFLTPRPTTFAPAITEELAVVRATPAKRVRRDLLATHAPGRPPQALQDAEALRDDPVLQLRDTICDLLERYWHLALEPIWSQLRLVLESDITYRARQLAQGGARLLFADMHPNLRWHGGVLQIDKMIGRHCVTASGRGLLLLPSLFAYKPIPPLSPLELPWLAYPSRGAATLWMRAAEPDPTVLTSLIGAPRARLLGLLDDPLPTVEIARRLSVTPSAVSQHLQVLYANGLVTRSRDGRHVLYLRSSLGDQLVGGRSAPPTL